MNRLLTLFLLGLSNIPTATAFVPAIPRQAFWTRHRAVIYSPDYENEDEVTIKDEAGDRSLGLGLEDYLTKERVASLARLAVAFSPPERALKLEHIEHVEVMSVQQSHIDIEAVLCEDRGCVSLAVPIKFPFPCNEDDEMADCVLDNLGTLDKEAAERILQQDTRESHEEAMREWREDHPTEEFDFPVWWVAPETVEGMLAESDSIMQLLNDDDFQPEMKALVNVGLGERAGSLTVIHAEISAVGPAGVIMRAFVKEKGGIKDSSIQLVTLEFPFATQAEDVGALRAAVLGAVASVTP